MVDAARNDGPQALAPDRPDADAAAFRIIGRRTRRSDAPERLAGQTRFTDDLAFPGLLHTRLVRSPYASARILRIDREAALRMQGVRAVLSAADLPVADLAQAVESRRVLLAHERVVYAGQPVAVVVAESDIAAEDGAQAVEVEYEPLQAVTNPIAAMAADAPVVRERRERDDAELAMHGAAPSTTEEAQSPSSPNVVTQTRQQYGNVDQGFAEADVVVEREYRTQWIHQGYIEPQTCIATVDPLGNVVVYACTQALFHVRREVAQTLGLPDRQVRVHPMPVGGGFGGKFGLIETQVAAIAMALRQPVKLTYHRMDEMVAACPAPGAVIRVKVGARADGTLTTVKAHLLYDAGSNPGAPVGISGMLLGSFYRWEHLLIEGVEVLTHKAGPGAYRGPGAPQAAFAIESAVDEMARTLGMDPFELRQRNAATTGDRRADGTPWPPMGLRQCLERAEAVYREEQASRGPNEGVGIALGGWFGGVEPAAAACRLDTDGTLQISLGSVDLTGTNTTFQMIAAETFGLSDASQVRVTSVDTDAAPYAGATGGSKITYTVGVAVERAARDAREQVLRIAAAELETSVEDLEIVEGRVQVRGVPVRSKTLREINALSASFGARYEPVYGRGQWATVERSPGTTVHVARVHVDPETGRVTPVRHVVVQDVGRAINPAAVEGQIHGGAAQAVGWGLYERLVFADDGTPLTGSFADYTLPNALQIPPLEVLQVEIPSRRGPYGAKGVGEPPVIPGAAAVANAVCDAVGVRLTELPLLSERVRTAIASATK